MRDAEVPWFDLGNPSGSTPLLLAAAKGHLEAVQAGWAAVLPAFGVFGGGRGGGGRGWCFWGVGLRVSVCLSRFQVYGLS